LSNSKASRGRVVHLDPHRDSTVNWEELADFVLGSDWPLAADLFCGAGGLSLGLERAGLKVVIGIDQDAYAIATHRAQHAGLSASWDLSNPETVQQLGSMVKDLGVSVVCGGPPCQPFSRAGRGIIRSLVDRGIRGESDTRRDLWQSFLEVVRVGRPKAVLMENVPDMAFDRARVVGIRG
jgi:DNA (cytosine-5)-methyltransferase 1